MSAPKNKEQENKPKPSLLPLDCLIELLCPAYEEGVLKYFRESWRLGFKVSDMFDACQRHLVAFYYKKEDYDQETLETYGIQKLHLGAAIFCMICMFWSIKINKAKFDDRPKYASRKHRIDKKFLGEK